MAEQAAADYKATEYTIVKENGKTLTVVQNNKPDEPVFRPGDRVLVQTSGSFQRVLPAAQLPTSMKKPQGIEFTN